MSILKHKAESLYEKLKLSREQLVNKYNAGGTIRYDEAIGLIPVGGNPAVSTAPAAVGGALVANNGRRETRVPDHREDGTVVGTRVVLDLASIKEANLLIPGAVTGSMMEALKLRAEGKTILLFSNDAALRYGTVILGEVKCQLKLMGDQVNNIRNAVFPGFQAANSTLNGVLNTGLIHALPGTIEQESLSHRGFAKPVNYRGDVEYLKDPTSIWATVDASLQPFMLLGINSEIRMFGEDQLIDLNGFRVGAHERPNRIAAFSCIVDLSDGHFSGLSTKGAKNFHIFSSQGVGKMLRCNHFHIRSHFARGGLIEGIQFGEEGFINQGSYFGAAIFNDPQGVVVKDCHGTQIVQKAVANSSMALSHYAQLTNIEVALGYFERPSTWETSGKVAYPWMKWEPIAVGTTDTFGNGKTTRFPVLKTEAELVTAGVPALAAPVVLRSLKAMMAAHKKSMLSADDTYMATNTGHNALNVVGTNRAGLSMDSLQRMTDVKQIPRSTNLIAQNPRTSDGTRYPDSVAYGIRFGSASEGVGSLAIETGGTVQDCYVMDCTFGGIAVAPMEMPTISAGSGSMKTFNGNGLRTFGYSNSIGHAHSMAPAMILMSKEAIESAIPAAKLEEKPVDFYDTAAKAAQNAPSSGFTAKLAHGLYKGNDVIEAGLAGVEALQLLKKYFTAAVPKAVLSGVDNSNVDIGILALRKSMLTAIDALTACHVGLKGGYQGDIFADDGTYYGFGEIYPWFVKGDGTVSIDKDIILQQAAARTDRRQTTAYLAKELPAISDSIFKLKFISAEKVALVTAQTETPVTYEQCIALLGFGSGTGPVEYKIGRSVDGQGHTHKGSLGVRADAASGIVIKNVTIQHVETDEARPAVNYLGSIQNQIDLGICPDSRPESGVLEVHGVSLNGVTEALVENVVVRDCHSGGTVLGLEIAGKSNQIEVENFKVESVEADQGGALAQPFGDQKAVGVKVKKGSAAKLSKIKVDGLVAARPDLVKEIEIESLEVEIS